MGLTNAKERRKLDGVKVLFHLVSGLQVWLFVFVFIQLGSMSAFQFISRDPLKKLALHEGS